MPVILERYCCQYKHGTDDVIEVQIAVLGLIEGASVQSKGTTIHLTCVITGRVGEGADFALKYLHPDHGKHIENDLKRDT